MFRLNGSQVEPLFDSLIKTYLKLIEIGFTKIDNKIIFIDEKVNHE